MNRLRKNGSKAFFLLGLLSFGCTTSSYRLLKVDEQSAELVVTPDRILMECEKLDAEQKEAYGFMIHLLDEKNTVTTLIQGNVLGKDACDDALDKIGRILRGSRRIYIAGRGRLEKPRQVGTAYFFPGIGSFPSNERSLYFAAIMNERGGCFDAYRADVKPCPRKPFPTTSN